MVVVDYWDSGTWPTPLLVLVTVPTGTYTKTFVFPALREMYIDGILKTQRVNFSNKFRSCWKIDPFLI